MEYSRVIYAFISHGPSLWWFAVDKTCDTWDDRLASPRAHPPTFGLAATSTSSTQSAGQHWKAVERGVPGEEQGTSQAETDDHSCQSLSVSISPISVARCRMDVESPALAITQRPLEQWRPVQARSRSTLRNGEGLGMSIGADNRTYTAASAPKMNIRADESVPRPQLQPAAATGWVMSADGNIVWMGLHPPARPCLALACTVVLRA